MLLLACGARPCTVAAQDELPWRCAAPRPALSERSDWYSAEGDYIRDTTPRTTQVVGGHFRGAYSLLVVRTEGGSEHLMDECQLRWAAPSESQSREIRRIGAVEAGALTVPLVGTLLHRRSAVGAAPKREPPPWDLSGPIQLEYWPKTGKLGFNIGLGIDTGTRFHITDIEADGSFAGRWSEGSMTVIQYETPLGPVAEGVRGYFCGIASPE